MNFFSFVTNMDMDNISTDDYDVAEELYSFPVLYIEEKAEQLKVGFDNKMFVYYSYKNGYYYITGKRVDTKTLTPAPYSFVCRKSKEVINFIRVMFGQEGVFNMVLYNYTNMPLDDLNSATYDFMINNIDEKYELTAYDNLKLEKEEKIVKILNEMLRICKHVNNYISEDEEDYNVTDDEQ